MALAVITLLILGFMNETAGLLALSVTAWVVGVTFALRHGGPYMTPSGVFFLASGVFVGGGAYYMGIVDTEVDPATLRDAAALALLTTIAMATMVTGISIGWRVRWPRRSEVALAPQPSPAPRQFALKALLLVLVSQIPVTESVLGPLAYAMGVGGVLMLVLWAGSRRLELRWYGDVLVVSLAFLLPVAWLNLTYTGGGRLQVAGVGVGAFVAWNLASPKRIQKILVILCIPVFLGVAGLDRLDQGGQADGSSATSVVSDGEGLGSVWGPLQSWAKIIGPLTPEQADRLGPRWGGTFWHTAVLPVPRAFWPDKPKGFGAELTEVFDPELVVKGHSEAGLMQGEWYANFGFAGLVLMVPFVGFLLAVLDRKHARLAWSGLRAPRAWWSAAVLVCAVSSLADLYWVGSFTFFARGGLAAIVIALVGMVSLSRRPPAGGAQAHARTRAAPTARAPGPLDIS